MCLTLKNYFYYYLHHHNLHQLFTWITVQIDIKSKTRSALKTLEIYKRVWIIEEINFLYSKLHLINIKIGELKTKMKESFYEETIEEIEEYVHNWYTPILWQKKNSQSRKFRILSSNKNSSNKANDDDSGKVSFYPTVQNLTNIELKC